MNRIGLFALMMLATLAARLQRWRPGHWDGEGERHRHLQRGSGGGRAGGVLARWFRPRGGRDDRCFRPLYAEYGRLGRRRNPRLVQGDRHESRTEHRCPGRLVAGGGAAASVAGGQTTAAQELLPAKYKNPATSGLTAKIAKDTKNEFTFELKD